MERMLDGLALWIVGYLLLGVVAFYSADRFERRFRPLNIHGWWWLPVAVYCGPLFILMWFSLRPRLRAPD